MRAKTTITSAAWPLPIQRLCPLSTHSWPSRRAEVSRATESEPCSGSVKANAPVCSNRAIDGSHRSFCSSEPSMLIAPMHRLACTPRNVLMLPSTRAISRATIPAALRVIPGQP